jgi:hypothetical protein
MSTKVKRIHQTQSLLCKQYDEHLKREIIRKRKEFEASKLSRPLPQSHILR